MAKGGKQPGAGRPAGPDKAKKMLNEILETLNCDPLKNLARIANGTPIKTSDDAEEYPKVSEQLAANKELLNYIHPKLTSTHHSGSIGTHEADLDELE